MFVPDCPSADKRIQDLLGCHSRSQGSHICYGHWFTCRCDRFMTVPGVGNEPFWDSLKGKKVGGWFVGVIPILIPCLEPASLFAADGYSSLGCFWLLPLTRKQQATLIAPKKPAAKSYTPKAGGQAASQRFQLDPEGLRGAESNKTKTIPDYRETNRVSRSKLRQREKKLAAFFFSPKFRAPGQNDKYGTQNTETTNPTCHWAIRPPETRNSKSSLRA